MKTAWWWLTMGWNLFQQVPWLWKWWISIFPVNWVVRDCVPLTGNNLLYTQLDVTYQDSYHGVFLISVTPLQFLFQIWNFNCHIRWRLTYICVNLRKNALYSYVYLTSIIVLPHTSCFQDYETKGVLCIHFQTCILMKQWSSKHIHYTKAFYCK